MPDPSTISQPSLPPRQGVQFALVFLAGAAIALIGNRLIQGRSTYPPTAQRGESPVHAEDTNLTGQARSAKPLPSRKIDLNRAAKQELLQLPGVGPATADGILAYRDAHGPFQRIDELRSVRGIGVATLEKLRPWLIVDVGESDEPARLVRKAGGAPKPANGALNEPIDLNFADAKELERLPGIGPTLAQRIVDERTKKPFATVDDLKRVFGIGPKKLEQVRPFVLVSN